MIAKSRRSRESLSRMRGESAESVIGDLLRQSPPRPLAVRGERYPYATGEIERGERGVATARAFLEERLYREVMLRRHEERKSAVGDLARESEHPRPEGTDVDRRDPRSPEAEVCLFRPPQVAPFDRRLLAREQTPDDVDRFPHRGERSPVLDTDPAEEIARPGGEAEMKSLPRELVEGGGDHRDLGRVDGIGVEDAGSDADLRCRPGDGGEDDGGALEKEIVAHPELVESRGLRRPREGDVVVDAVIVVEADAEGERLRHSPSDPDPTMASASISTRYSAPMRSARTRVFAGRIRPKRSP